MKCKLAQRSITTFMRDAYYTTKQLFSPRSLLCTIRAASGHLFPLKINTSFTKHDDTDLTSSPSLLLHLCLTMRQSERCFWRDERKKNHLASFASFHLLPSGFSLPPPFFCYFLKIAAAKIWEEKLFLHLILSFFPDSTFPISYQLFPFTPLLLLRQRPKNFYLPLLCKRLV